MHNSMISWDPMSMMRVTITVWPQLKGLGLLAESGLIDRVLVPHARASDGRGLR